MKEKLRLNKGITLIALIITIIVLLILAMVTIKLVLDGGILQYTNKAVDDYNEAQANELEQLANAAEKMKQFGGKNDDNNSSDNWWEIKDDKEKVAIQNAVSSYGDAIIAMKEENTDYGYRKMAGIYFEPENATIHYIMVGEVQENGEAIMYVCPITDLAIQSFEEQMKKDAITPFILEKGKWFTMSNEGSHFASNDKVYNGSSPIQLSDFADGTIVCQSYLERVIASFNN